MSWFKLFGRNKTQDVQAPAEAQQPTGEICAVARHEVEADGPTSLNGTIAGPCEPPVHFRTIPGIDSRVSDAVRAGGNPQVDPQLVHLIADHSANAVEAGAPIPLNAEHHTADMEALRQAERAIERVETNRLRTDWLRAKLVVAELRLAGTRRPLSQLAQWTQMTIVTALGAGAAYVVGPLMGEGIDLVILQPWMLPVLDGIDGNPLTITAESAMRMGWGLAALQVGLPLVIALFGSTKATSALMKCGVLSVEAMIALGFALLRVHGGLGEQALPVAVFEGAIAIGFALACQRLGDALAHNAQLKNEFDSASHKAEASRRQLAERAEILARSCTEAVQAVAVIRLAEQAKIVLDRRIQLASSTAQVAYYEAVQQNQAEWYAPAELQKPRAVATAA